jgi:O-antigen ligase
VTVPRLRLQLRGAIQFLVGAYVATVAAASSNLWPLNIPIGRKARWVVLGELAAVALMYAFVSRPWPSRFRARGAVAGAFLALCAASIAWSPDPRLTLGRTLTLVVLFATAGAIALATAGRSRAAGEVLLGVLGGAVVIAVGGIVLWLADRDSAVVPATLQSPARFLGLGANPNTMSMLFAIAVPLAVWALLETASWWGRLAAAAVILLLVGSIVASGSRGALVAAFVGVVVLAWVARPAPRRRLALVLAATAALGAGVAITEVPQPAKRNPVLYQNFGRRLPISPLDLTLTRPLENELGVPKPGYKRSLLDTSGRLPAWKGAFKQALQRPVVGYGFGTEALVFVDRYALFFSSLVENSYLGTMLQLGVVGLCLLLALFVALALGARRDLAGASIERRRVAAACAGGFAAGIVLAATQSYLTSVGSPPTAPFWLCAFLLGAAALPSRGAPQAPAEPERLGERVGDEGEQQAAQGHREPRLDVVGGDYGRVHEEQDRDGARGAAATQGERGAD